MGAAWLTGRGRPDWRTRAMARAVVEVETARLVLRPLIAAVSTAMDAGARLDGWAADFPAPADVEHVALAASAPPPVGPFGYRLVVERGSGLAVGSVGLEDLGDQAELFFGIVSSRRGRGFGAEAARAMAAHAYAGSAVKAVIAMVETENVASLRALERAGFAHNGFPPVDGTAIFEARRM